MKNDDAILLSHGSGGKLTHRLLQELIKPYFSNPILEQNDDSAVFRIKGRTAFTTDSFVVKPLFFPGGDIGKLAVCGTVNDLCVMGAKALYLTAACIIEEGFSMAMLEKIIRSMAAAAAAANIRIVGGDLKVVEKKACDGIFINTSGIGVIAAGLDISARRAQPGDEIIVNGMIAEHAAAIMAARQDYRFSTRIKSDCAALNGLIAAVLKACPSVHVMRDPTRGGVATTLNEIASSSGVEIELEEKLLPVCESVRGFCEILGIDPLYMANEGKVLVFVRKKDSAAVISAMRRHPLGKKARVIGRVVKKSSPVVLLRTAIGSRRILDMLTGEQLPRIC